MPKSLFTRITRKESYKGFLSDVDFKFGIRMKLAREAYLEGDANSKPLCVLNPLFYYNRIPVFKWKKKPVDIDGNNGPTNESYYNFLNDYLSKGDISKIKDLISTAVVAKYIYTHSKVTKNIANIDLMKIEELAISNAALECISALRNIIESDDKKSKADTKCLINRNTIADRVKDFVKRQVVSESETLANGSVFVETTLELEKRENKNNLFSKYIDVGSLQGYQDNVLALTREEVRAYCFVADMTNNNSDGAISRLINYLAKHDFLSKVIYTGATFSRLGYNLTERSYEDDGKGILVAKNKRVNYKYSELKDFDTEIRRVDLPNFIECYIKVYMTLNYILEDALSNILGNTSVFAHKKCYNVSQRENGKAMALVEESKEEVGEYTITLEPRFV